MGEYLYRVADRDALRRLYGTGIRIRHRFPASVVLSEPLAYAIDGVTLVEPSDHPLSREQMLPEEIGEIAFAIRQSEAFQARKANRPAEGESIEDVIDGTVNDLP